MALTFLRDTFNTGGQDIDLRTRIPEVGAAWAKQSYTATEFRVVFWGTAAYGYVTNQFAQPDTWAYYVNRADPKTPDYGVTITHFHDVNVQANATGVMLRANEASTAYDVYIWQNTIWLRRRVNGALTALASYPIPGGIDANPHVTTAKIEGQRITVEYDGVVVIDHTDNAPGRIVDTGRAGIIGTFYGFIDDVTASADKIIGLSTGTATGTGTASAVGSQSRGPTGNIPPFLQHRYNTGGVDKSMNGVIADRGLDWFQSGQNSIDTRVVFWGTAAYGNSQGTGSYLNVAGFSLNRVAPPTSDYYVHGQVFMDPAVAGAVTGVIGRANWQGRNGYDAIISGGRVYLNRRVEGVATNLGSYLIPGGVVWFQRYDLVLKMLGRSIIVELDGVDVISVVDPAPITAAGHPGTIAHFNGFVDYIEAGEMVALKSATGSATGTGTMQGTGVSFRVGFGHIHGEGKAQGAGLFLLQRTGTGSSAGKASVTGEGLIVAYTTVDASASGRGSAAGVGHRRNEMTALAEGQSYALGVSENFAVTGTVTGKADMMGQGSSRVLAVARSFNARGFSLGFGVAMRVGEGTGTAAGSSSMKGVKWVEVIRPTTGSASGLGLARGITPGAQATRGTAFGKSGVSGTGRATATATGTAFGITLDDIEPVFIPGTSGTMDGTASMKGRGFAITTGIPTKEDRIIFVAADVRLVILGPLPRDIIVSGLTRQIALEPIDRELSLPADPPRTIILPAIKKEAKA